MKVSIYAVGRLRRGPELELLSDYLDRFNKQGRSMGLGPVDVIEVEDKKNIGMRAEADLLEKAIPSGAKLITLDERGKLLTSPEFSKCIANFRDQGQGHLAFVIGGADGIDPALRARADMPISFGSMVWPHMLVRVMLSEQLYRAASILAGTPYHRA